MLIIQVSVLGINISPLQLKRHVWYVQIYTVPPHICKPFQCIAWKYKLNIELVVETITFTELAAFRRTKPES